MKEKESRPNRERFLIYLVASIALAIAAGNTFWLIALPEPAKLPEGVLRYHDGQLRSYDAKWDYWDCANDEVAEAIELTNLQKKFDCFKSGGHKWEFTKRYMNGWTGKIYYLFKCSKCGEKLHKTEDELTADERDALIKLGIIK